MSRKASRWYALSMAILNLMVGVALTLLCLINAVYDWPNVFVAIAGPLFATVFGVISAIWFVESAMRRVTRAGAWREMATPGSALSERVTPIAVDRGRGRPSATASPWHHLHMRSPSNTVSR